MTTSFENNSIEECNSYPFEVITTTVADKNITVVGVAHVYDFFVENRSYLTRLVDENDAVMLESPVGGYFWDINPRNGFYRNLGEYVGNQEKHVFQADPVNEGVFGADYVSSAVGLSAMSLGTYDLIKNITSAVQNRKKVPNRPQFKPSRRDFIKNLAAIGIGSSLTLGSFNLGVGISLFSNEEFMNYTAVDFITWGSLDYRNIKIASGIERLCRNCNDFENLVVFHGAAHTDPIAFYLENPALRLKVISYFPFEIFGDRTVREYARTDNIWELVREY